MFTGNRSFDRKANFPMKQRSPRINVQTQRNFPMRYCSSGNFVITGQFFPVRPCSPGKSAPQIRLDMQNCFYSALFNERQLSDIMERTFSRKGDNAHEESGSQPQLDFRFCMDDSHLHAVSPAGRPVPRAEREPDALLRGRAQPVVRVHRIFHACARDGCVYGRHPLADPSVGNASG